MAINKRLINTGGGGVEVPTSFNTVTYTGNGSTQNVGGVGFQPDLVWGKARTDSISNILFDSVRGENKQLSSNNTSAEVIRGSAAYEFKNDGFTVTTVGNLNNAEDYVAWCWKAGGAAVTNTDGSISSEVSANVDAGFSVVKYTGNGSVATVGHALDVAPSLIIVKNLGSTTDWYVYGFGLTSNAYFLKLNSTAAEASDSTVFNSTSPTSTVFSIGTSTGTNGVNDLIAYCFAEKAGFSKIGSYTGNGSATGTTVTTDFEPAFVMIKRTDSTGNWVILDNKRDTSNPIDKTLNPNLSAVESTANDIDFNATTFQLKSTNADTNANTATYIYMAFANQF